MYDIYIYIYDMYIYAHFLRFCIIMSFTETWREILYHIGTVCFGYNINLAYLVRYIDNVNTTYKRNVE